MPRAHEVHQRIQLATRTLTPPILTPAVAPAKALVNDQWCVEGRIELVRNDTPCPPKYQKYVLEYIDLFCAGQKLHPLDHAEVFEAQDRPTQRAGNLRAALNAGFEQADPEVKSFQKSELYGKPNDPRNISTLPHRHCFNYSRFTLAVAAHMKRHVPWYVFGKHPVS